MTVYTYRKLTKGMRIEMILKKILPLLLALLTICLLAGCDGRDGDTSGSAESNGVISDTSRDNTSKRPDTSKEESKEESKDFGDHVSDMISDVESVVSDLVDGQ